MNSPVILTQTDFFEDFSSTKEAIVQSEFKDHVVEHEGISYPMICKDLPRGVRYEFLYKLEHALGARISPNFIFARAMPQGVRAVNAIHSDRDMGSLTAHVYIGGCKDSYTAFYEHREFGMAPEAHVGQEHFDSHNFTHFKEYMRVMAIKNMLHVHHSAPFHCAHPTEGKGADLNTSRLVLTCFFNLL